MQGTSTNMRATNAGSDTTAILADAPWRDITRRAPLTPRSDRSNRISFRAEACARRTGTSTTAGHHQLRSNAQRGDDIKLSPSS